MFAAHAKVLELKKTQGALSARGGQRGWKAETEEGAEAGEPAGPCGILLCIGRAVNILKGFEEDG